MNIVEMLDTFSLSVRVKARKLNQATDTPIVPDGPAEMFPQVWRVRGSEGTTYKVQLVCDPGLEALSEREIHGATCACPNGKNTPLGVAKCYHVAAVLTRLVRVS